MYSGTYRGIGCKFGIYFCFIMNIWNSAGLRISYKGKIGLFIGSCFHKNNRLVNIIGIFGGFGICSVGYTKNTCFYFQKNTLSRNY
jgi:hypothetical protein